MDIKISEGYSDASHIFGICHVRVDGLDRFGRTQGSTDDSGRASIHRDGLTKQEAIDWLKDWAEDGGDLEAFRIVARPRPVWETVESGARSSVPSKSWR